METLELNIAGMHCKSCEEVIGDAIGEVNGVKEVKVDSKTGKAVIKHESADLVAIKKAVAGAGYKVK